MGRKKKEAEERAKVAQVDMEVERERLLKEQNCYDDLDKEHRVIAKLISDLKIRSTRAEEDEERFLTDLKRQKLEVVKLIQESRAREDYHYDQSKRLADL
jgi:hypothetical protein